LTGGFAQAERSTGVLNLQMPTVDGDVRVVYPDGDGGVYIGGDFTGVGGFPRKNAAHIRADGTVSAWAPEANERVWSIVRDGSRIFLGGWFSQVGGQQRDGVAAVDATTGVLLPWTANRSGLSVWTLAMHGGKLYASRCVSAPAVPQWLAAGVAGRRVTVLWEYGGGPAPSDYLVTASGIGSGTTGGMRRVSGDLGPGTYDITVQAVNACGTSVPATTYSIVVP